MRKLFHLAITMAAATLLVGISSLAADKTEKSVAFRTVAHNRYVSIVPQGGLNTSGAQITSRQTFVLADLNGGELADDDSIQIRWQPAGTKPTYWQEGEGNVHRTGGKPDAACTFKVKLKAKADKNAPQPILLQTASGRFVSVQSKGAALTTTETQDNAATFEIVDVPKSDDARNTATTAAAVTTAAVTTATVASAAAVTTPAGDQKPTIFVVGDSTARNNANGAKGWGDPFAAYFDPAKVIVLNRAMAGRSTRTYTAEGRWDNIVKELKAGDYVLIQMGHNDGGPVDSDKRRASLPGLGEETQEITKPDGAKEIVHTYGWYLRKFVAETKAKGATPILLSLTVRNIWKEGRVERGNGRYGQWASEVAQAEGVPFIDVTGIIADQYQQMGEDKTKAMFGPDYVHTSPAGADLNAATIAAGLKRMGSPLVNYLSEKGKAVDPSNPSPTGDAAQAEDTDKTATTAATATTTAATNTAAATAPSGDARSQGITTPALQISDVPRETQAGAGPGRYVSPVPARADLSTLWLIGDSTVRNGSSGDNGPNGQWGWGAPLTAYFDLSKINVVNRALGGTSSRSFYNGNLWNDLKPLIKKGDFVVMQFGHNDINPDKGSLKGTEEKTEVKGEEKVHTFGWYLKQFVEETRAQGATPVICSLTARKRWSEDGKFQGGGSYREWAEQVARETGALYLPLNEIISQRYHTLGREKVDTMFVPSPKENLHTGWDGAVFNAESVIAGLKALSGNPFKEFFSARAGAIAPWKG